MIWQYLGFTRDIFFVEPLRPNSDDIKLFVGRDDEIRKYLVDSLSGGRALKIVSGEVGVGKTTFVNACQYFSYKKNVPVEFKFDLPKVLPCFEKIQLRESDNLDEFFQQTITAVCQSIAFHCKLSQQDPPREVKEILSYFLDLVINTGGAGYTAGISIAGFGGDIGRSTDTRAINIIRNARFHLQRLVILAREELGFRGIFVTVNNLDILPKDKLIKFLNVARDELFDIDGIYWTLIGRKGIGSIIESEAERVADYLSGTESYIEPLDFARTKDVIDVRVRAFGKTTDVQCPLSDRSIRAFHYLSMREIRETLKICGEIVKRVLAFDPSSTPIPDETATKSFIQYAHDRAKDLDLTPSHVKILEAVYEKKSCRPRDYKLYGYQTPQAFIVALKGLVGKRLLSVEEKGRARIYRMTGMTMFAAITGALGKDIRDVASEQLDNVMTAHQFKDEHFGDAQLELDLDSGTEES